MNIFPARRVVGPMFARPSFRDTIFTALLPEIFVCLSTAFLIAALCRKELTHDVAWQLSIANAILSGDHLYTGIVELNPPLWFWMAIPVQRLASLIGISANILLFIAIGSAAALALITTSRLLVVHSKSCKIKLLVYAAVLLTIMPGADFGQREHLALIAAIPWAALAALRIQQTPVKPLLAITVAVFCAFGFALKHYFVLPLMGLEIWVAFSLRWRWTAFRPENVTLLCMAILYVGALLVITPDFLSDIVPMIRSAYWGYEVPRRALFIGFPQTIWVASTPLLIWMSFSRGEGLSAFEKALAISALGFGVAFLVQGKGWPYQAIAVTGCLSLSIVSYLFRRWDSLSALRRMLIEFVAALPVLFGCANLSYANPYAPYFDESVSDLSLNARIFVMSVDPMLAWPMVRERKLAWHSRYYAFWMIPAIARADLHHVSTPELERLDRSVIEHTVEDLRCSQPQRILIERHPTNYGMSQLRFNFVLHFSKSAAFAGFMTNYREVAGNRIFRIFERTTTHQPVSKARCS